MRETPTPTPVDASRHQLPQHHAPTLLPSLQHRHSQSWNQLPSVRKPSLAPLKPEASRLLRRASSQHLQSPPSPNARRRSDMVVSVPRTPQPQPMITRRGSLMLHATMRAMAQAPLPSRRKSNQDDESEEQENEENECADATTNQTEPPPYFRLETFMLEDHEAPRPESVQPSSTTITSPRREAAPPQLNKAAQIDAIFREIFVTEDSYVADLRGLVTQFFEPLQAFAKIHDIALGAMAALHHSTSTILSIHEELLRQLTPLQTKEPLVSDTDAKDPFGVGFTGTLARLHHLARAFLSTIEYMKVYAFYCGSYLAAKQELESLQRAHPKLAQFTAQLNECARRGSQEDDDVELPPLDINSSLIKPVQRICRYPLLFKSLLGNASGPEETLVLQQSLQRIEAVSTYVNEKVRESQNNARLYELHEMLHPSSNLELLQPSRTLVAETWGLVTSLDALRWPAKLLKHLRRRRHRTTNRRCASVSAPGPPPSSSRDDRFFLSVFGLGDDHRPSASAPTPTISSSSDRHASFSAATRLLQRRMSTTAERSRLILLSDMLLMAKLRDNRLKIRRQICLSCAVIHDDHDVAPSPPCPEPRPSVDDTAAASFTLEVSKVGRCSCHHLSPVTLQRSPQLRSLSAFLHGRRTSGSRTSSSSDLAHTAPRPTPRARKSSGGSRFRYLEQLAGLRSVKRYRVTCDSVQDKRRFLLALRPAIARSARLQLLAHSSSSADLAAPSTSAKAMAMAASLPVKIWRSIRSTSEAGFVNTTPTPSRRRAGSVALLSSSVAGGCEEDLLNLDEDVAPWSPSQVNAA